MMFNSIEFVLFFVVLLTIIYFIDKKNNTSKVRNIVLLIASLLYYLLIDYKYFLLFICITLITYFIGLKVRNNKKVITLGVTLLVLLLTFFKYNNFFISNVLNNDFIRIIMPVGISFYIFKAISYMVDVYRGKYECERNFVKVALYLSLFTEVVSGPISRFNDLSKQFDNNTKLGVKYLTEGVQVFVIGLFKKIVVADNISVFVNEVYRAPRAYSSLTVLLCIVGYAVYIYMDFSGYSDMAIGCSKMLGYDIKKNFNCPYISKNITEFWKRWHISLSNWIMDYIYIPLGGNRKGKTRQYINLVLTMFIGGLWHGSSYMFAIWGLINGLALAIQKRFFKKDTIITIIMNYIFILISWITFKASDINNFLDILNQLWFKTGISYISTWALFGIFVVILDIILSIKNNKEEYYPIQDLTTIKGLVIFFLIIGLTLGLGYTGANPFVYSNF